VKKELLEEAEIPPEQLRIGDGKIGFGILGPEGFEILDSQIWQCLWCQVEIEKEVCEGEPLRKPSVCPNCEKKGPFKLLTPTPALKPEWHPPSGFEEVRMNDLFREVRSYIASHVNLEHEHQYDGLAIWSLMTWQKDVFPFSVHLCIMAPSLSGKTRLCRTLSEISYHGYNAAAATESTLFRTIDEHDVTPFVSEFSGLPRETRRSVHNIIRAAQKRGEPIARSVRVGKQWEVESFDTYTPLAVASQFDFPDDVKNRAIIIDMHYDADDIEPILRSAADLRDKLLYYRFVTRAEAEVFFEDSIEELYERGVRGRVLEQLAPLKAIAKTVGRNISEFLEWQERRHRAIQKEQIHVQICKVLSRRIRENHPLTVKAIADEFNQNTERDWGPRKMGRKLSDLGIDRRKDSSGRMAVRVPSAVESIRMHGEPFGVEVPDVQKKIE